MGDWRKELKVLCLFLESTANKSKSSSFVWSVILQGLQLLWQSSDSNQGPLYLSLDSCCKVYPEREIPSGQPSRGCDKLAGVLSLSQRLTRDYREDKTSV